MSHDFSDNVAHPKHYNQGSIEVIEYIEDQELGFRLGNVVKYISRAGRKDPAKVIEDLKKAQWYLQREIEIQVARKEGRPPCRPNDMPKIPLYKPEEKKTKREKRCLKLAT